jgi:glycosyltransferase involved in cell wall biosynthesis
MRSSFHSANERVVAHLMASPFLGGPERQVLGLARNLGAPYRTIFISFAERGLAEPFEQAAREEGFSTIRLAHNAPDYGACVREIVACLREQHVDVLCCHGYKPDLLGLLAARRSGIPVVSVSRGWTGSTLKVRANELLDRMSLHAMDRVVCVSAAQAKRVRRAFVSSRRIVVIRNAIDGNRFSVSDPTARRELESMFACSVSSFVLGAGRLSPEKGFSQLVDAARMVCRRFPLVGFVVYGDGPLRERLAKQIATAGLRENFVLAGFRNDVDRFLPHADVVAISSYTEGLANIALEAHAAGVPIVATNVGGNPEIVEDGKSGRLVPAGHSGSFAAAICELLSDKELRRAFGGCGQSRIRCDFTFDAQAAKYRDLFDRLCNSRPRTAAFFRTQPMLDTADFSRDRVRS